MRSEREEVTREETIEGEVRPPLRGREGEGERGERGGKRGRCPVTGCTKVTERERERERECTGESFLTGFQQGVLRPWIIYHNH